MVGGFTCKAWRVDMMAASVDAGGEETDSALFCAVVVADTKTRETGA